VKHATAVAGEKAFQTRQSKNGNCVYNILPAFYNAIKNDPRKNNTEMHRSLLPGPLKINK
jgi:hypothetical protein